MLEAPGSLPLKEEVPSAASDDFHYTARRHKQNQIFKDVHDGILRHRY